MRAGSVLRKWLIVISAMLVSGCAESVDDQKARALEIVQNTASARETVKQTPGQSWHVLRDDEYDVLLEGRNLNYWTSEFCPGDFRVFYGKVGTDRADRIFVWYVDLDKDGVMSSHPTTLAKALKVTSIMDREDDPSTPNPEDDFCDDGQPVQHAILRNN